MKSIAELIREHPFLAELPADACASFAGCARNRVFKPGEYIFREGQPADEFHLVRHGRVALEVYAPRHGSVVYQTLGPDEVLGASWIVPPYRWTADARAIDLVRTVAFDAACMRGKCEADSALGYALMKRFVPIILQRMTAARMQALDVYGTPT